MPDLGDEEHQLGPDEFAWMPRDVPHAFANVGETAGEWVGFVSRPVRWGLLRRGAR